MSDILDSASVIVGAPTLGYHLLDLEGNLLSLLTMEGAQELLRDHPGLRKRSYQVSFPKEPRDTQLEELLDRRFSPEEALRTFSRLCPDLKSVVSPLDGGTCPHCHEQLGVKPSGKVVFQQIVQLLKSRGLLNKEFWNLFRQERPNCIEDKNYLGGGIEPGIRTIENLFMDLW